MPRRLKPIPKFKNEDEEREFWGTHDTTEYFDWSKASFVTFPNLKLSTETISLRLPAGLLADLKVLANRMDVPYQSLMKIYLAERVEQEVRRDLSPTDLASVVREPEAPYGVAPSGTHRKPSGARAGKKQVQRGKGRR
jgi:hypothetical protein